MDVSHAMLLPDTKDAKTDFAERRENDSTFSLTSCSLDELRTFAAQPTMSPGFVNASEFSFLDSEQKSDKVAVDNPGQDLEVTVPKGTGLVIGGSGCHIDVKVSPKGQMVITPKPGAECDVSFVD